MGKKTGGKGGGALGPEDFQLWKAFTHDIDPLEPPDWDAAAPPPVAPQESVPYQAAKTRPAVTGASTVSDPNPQLDARTETRLKRGQMPVEARLDLHGMTQEQAHTRLNDFVLAAHARGKRCVLVITGKGLSKGRDSDASVGVLRQKLPLWLSMQPLRSVVLKSYPAVQRDGGTGAWYLYLKRTRDY